MSGLSLRTDAVKALQSVLKQEGDNVDEALNAILTAISKRLQSDTSTSSGMLSSVVDVALIAQVVTDLTKDSDDRLREALAVVDAYDTPRLCYDPVKKSFYFYSSRMGVKSKANNSSANAPSPGSSNNHTSTTTSSTTATPGALNSTLKPFHGSAHDKVTMYRERFQMVKQRVLRNPLFCRPTIGGVSKSQRSGNGHGSSNGGHIELTPIDSLLGARGTLVLLGTLTRREESSYYLEDLNGAVEIDLSEVRLYFIQKKSVCVVVYFLCTFCYLFLHFFSFSFSFLCCVVLIVHATKKFADHSNNSISKHIH